MGLAARNWVLTEYIYSLCHLFFYLLNIASVQEGKATQPPMYHIFPAAKYHSGSAWKLVHLSQEMLVMLQDMQPSPIQDSAAYCDTSAVVTWLATAHGALHQQPFLEVLLQEEAALWPFPLRQLEQIKM